MSSSEKQLGIVKDIVLPLDINTRYDFYFMDKRIAIVCMGRANRFESETLERVSLMPSAFGVPSPASSYVEKTQDRQSIDEEIKNWSIDDLLKLSKKSCFYTYDEIEEVKLILGHKPKFIILSKECESKFSPNEEQLKQLSEILPTIETLRNKFSIAGSWNILQEILKGSFCQNCGSRNDFDAVYCQSCGKKIAEEPIITDPFMERVCVACGTKNKIKGSFCKQCGTPILLNYKTTDSA
jgi:ribosomal protein L40E